MYYFVSYTYIADLIISEKTVIFAFQKLTLLVSIYSQNIHDFTGNKLEHFGNALDLQSEHRLRDRAVHNEHCKGNGIFQLDPYRPYHLRFCSCFRSSRLVGYTWKRSRRLDQAWKDIANLAAKIQVPLVDEEGRKSQWDLPTCRWWDIGTPDLKSPAAFIIRAWIAIFIIFTALISRFRCLSSVYKKINK